MSNPNHASNMTFEQRMELMKKLARDAGLRLPTTILPEGTALWDVGENNKRKLERELADLPDIFVALAGLAKRIELEHPVDVTGVPVQLVRMNQENGRLYKEGFDPGMAIGYTNSGFSQVANFIRPASVRNGYVSTLLSLSPGVRAMAFNEHAVKNTERESVTLRTIVEPVSRSTVIRAVTSPKHSLETGDDRMVIQSLTETSIKESLRGAKARITRGQNRSEFEIIWPAMARELKVGDLCYIGIRIRNSETKAGSLEVEVFILRVLCANFTTAFSKDTEGETISIRHMGDIRHKLVEAFARALRRAGPFVTAFADAYKNKLPKTRGEMLAMVGEAYDLPEYLLTEATTLWDADGLRSAGDTLAGLVNALTRASQNQDIEDASATERAAGDLISRGWDALK